MGFLFFIFSDEIGLEWCGVCFFNGGFLRSLGEQSLKIEKF